MSMPPMPGPSVELVLGPMLIGVFANTILYGILVVQSFIYYQTYKKDPSWIRYFVLYLFVMETLNTGFNIGMMYEPLIRRFGTLRAITVSPYMLSADPIVTVMISTPVQLFMAWRIQIINKSISITSIIIFFATCAFIGGVATTVSVTLIPEYSRLQEFHGAVITWLASSAVGDIIITASLSWSLYRRRTGFRHTDDQISRIMRLTVQTGAITAASAAADVIIFILVPRTTLNFIWDFALGKLYTNSLLSTLNARAGWDHLTGNMTDTHNVLFGDQGITNTTGSSSRFGSSTDRQISKVPSQRHPVRPQGVYELNTYISSIGLQSRADNDHDADSDSKASICPTSLRAGVTANSDLEKGPGSGIFINRVVERVVHEDYTRPRPAPSRPHTAEQRGCCRHDGVGVGNGFGFVSLETPPRPKSR